MIISEGLRALLFGMLGIFAVMCIIIAATVLLNRFAKKENDT